MKRISIITALISIHFFASAQNVGIGLNTGIDARLHVAKADSGLAIFDNTATLADSLKSRILFKSGGNYTGGIGTHITDPNGPYARLGFFTFASTGSNNLKERMSITDGGSVGIGTVLPTALLDVAGTFRLRGNGAAGGQVLTSDALGNATWQTPYTFSLPYSGTSSATSNALRIVNTAASGGAGSFETSSAANQSYSLSGINNYTGNGGGVGVYGRANAGTSTVSFGVRGGLFGTGTAGYGVWGEATNADGVGGQSQTGTGVTGLAYAAGGLGGYFAGFGGADAFRTVGTVKMTGIGEGAGKVLTSDANGNATWQTAKNVTKVTLPTIQNIPSSTLYNNLSITAGCSSCFDDLNVMNGNSFSIQKTGVYEVSVNLAWQISSFSGSAKFEISVGESSSSYTEYLRAKNNFSYNASSTEQNQNLTGIIKLTAGTYLSISARQESGISQSISSSTTATNASIKFLY